jgi:large subunit ribosomal protein L35
LPKLKTHKGAAARFSTTGTGKLRRMKGNRNKYRRKKPASVRRLYSRKVEASKGDAARIIPLLPKSLR